MPDLCDNPLDAALMDSVPLLPVPRSGRSPAIADLAARRAATGFVIGHDGVHLMVRRPWLDALLPVSHPLPIANAYGAAGPGRLELTCGLIPGHLLDAAHDQFLAAIPNEDGAFILWNEHTRAFRLVPAEVLDASPSRLRYTPCHPGPGEHLVADIHSHGAMRPFWSVTDDEDDSHRTVLSLVFGLLGQPDLPARFIARLCTPALLRPLNTSPATATQGVVFQPGYGDRDDG